MKLGYRYTKADLTRAGWSEGISTMPKSITAGVGKYGISCIFNSISYLDFTKVGWVGGGGADFNRNQSCLAMPLQRSECLIFEPKWPFVWYLKHFLRKKVCNHNQYSLRSYFRVNKCCLHPSCKMEENCEIFQTWFLTIFIDHALIAHY